MRGAGVGGARCRLAGWHGGWVRAVRGEGWRARALRLAWLVWMVPATMTATVAGCGGAGTAAGVGPGPPPGASTEAARVIGEFLDAANQRDHTTMARLFGTGDGPIGDRGGTLGCAVRKLGSWIGLGERCLDEREVEQRLDLMAAVLKHESYLVRTEEAVVGRGRPATGVRVEMDVGARGMVEVPFVVILTADGRWLVEEVGLGRLVGR